MMTDKIGTAIEAMRRDRLLTMIRDGCVVAAMNDYGPIDPEEAASAAHDIALVAVTLALKRMIDEGDGLAALIRERDMYRDAYKELAMLLPPKPMVLAPTPAPSLSSPPTAPRP